MLHDDWWPKEFGRGYNGDVRTVRAWGVSGMFCETISTETSVYVACCVRRAKSFFFLFFPPCHGVHGGRSSSGDCVLTVFCSVVL